jgi:hypothetical protein
MSNPITLRKLTPQDRAQWEPLWDNYTSFYEREPNPAITAHLWQRTHAAQPNAKRKTGALCTGTPARLTTGLGRCTTSSLRRVGFWWIGLRGRFKSWHPYQTR